VKDFCQVFNLLNEIPGLWEVLQRELPLEMRNHEEWHRFSAEWVVGMPISPLRPEFLKERAALGSDASTEFHLVYGVWVRTLGDYTDRVLSLYPESSVCTVEDAMRMQERLQQIQEIWGYSANLRWRHLIRIVRDFATGQMRVVIYNLD